MDMKLEVAVLPVSDVERAKHFYKALGWREDADIAVDEKFRVVQLTPPGSPASIHVGIGLTDAAPGSGKSYLVVTDIEAARAELLAQGADVSEVFHREGSTFVPGPDPNRGTYQSYASFRDPDGNTWLLQEITTRFPGRVDPAETAYASTDDLASALRRAAAAHGEHEARTGQADPEWPAWYADYMVHEQAGDGLPT
jgi:catechol 2,3-dioxygenase-like lactoylglutathione lyase family enzyme